MPSVFVDSTTVLYSQDTRYPIKQQQAVVWLKTLILSNSLIVSPQTLNETYWLVRRKPEFAQWRDGVRTFLDDLMVHAASPLDASALREAWRIEDRYRTGFWDALQLTSANAAGCGHFLSEDLNDGQLYGAVRVINPFRHAPGDVLGPALTS